MEVPTSIKIFVVNDNNHVRSALQHWLEVEFPPFEVLGFTSIEEALSRSLTPDLVVMDLGYSQQEGIASMRKLKLLLPAVPIVILTMFDDRGHRTQAMEAGAEAFVSVRTMHEELIPQLTQLLSRVHV